MCVRVRVCVCVCAYRQSQARKPNGSGVGWAECSLIIGTGCWVQVFSLILDSSVGLSAGIQSAGDSVPKTLQILHSAEEDNLSPFDLKIACLCQSIEINNNKHVCMHACMHECMWQLAVLPQSGGREFNPRRVHDKLSLPLWVYMR